MEYSTIYHPTELPFKGLYSKYSSVALGAGMYQTAKNWRLDDGVLRVRYPMTRLASWGTFSGKATGARQITANGVDYAVFVSNNDGSIQSLELASGTVTSVSASSGKYGDTRLNNGTDDQCYFSVFRDNIAEQDYVAISDGVGALRIWNPLESDAGKKVCIANSITAPTNLPVNDIILTMPKYFTVKDLGSWSKTDTASGYTSSEEGTANPTGFWRHSIGTGVTSPPASAGVLADYTTGTFASVDLSDCDFIYFLVKTSYRAWIDNIRIDLGSATIWDSSASTSKYKYPIVVPVDSTGQWNLIGFSIGEHGIGATTSIKVGWTGAADPSAAQTVDIYGIFGAGKIRGNAYHTTSWMNSGSRVESPGCWYDPTDYTGEYFKNIGCSDALTTKIPNDPRLFYRYVIYTPVPISAQRDAGVDTFNIYRSDIGEDGATRVFCTSHTIATYSGSWSYYADSEGNTPTSGSRAAYYDDIPTESRNIARQSPDVNSSAPPQGVKWLESNGERLFLLEFDQPSNPGAAACRMWASDTFSPMRFRDFHATEFQGTMVELQGEMPVRLIQVPTSLFGVNTMFLFTDKNLYQFSPTSSSAINQLRRVAPYGTLCPYSVVASMDAIYWLDQSKKVREFTGTGINDLTSTTIQDKLNSICGSGWEYVIQYNRRLAFGGFFDEKYYLSVDQAGTGSLTNDTEEPLVFDTRSRTWFEDDLGGSTYSTRYWITLRERLFTFSKDGKIYRYEDPDSAQATDGYYYTGAVAGTGYTATLKTGSFFPGMKGDGAGILAIYTDVMSDDFDSGTMSYTYAYLPSGGAPTQSASIDASTTVKWSTPSAVPSGSTQGGLAVSVEMIMSSGCAGKRLYGARLRWEPRDYRPSV